MVDIWVQRDDDPMDAFQQGRAIGQDMGREVRNARAYQDGGYGAVEEQAARTGDLEGANTGARMAAQRRRFADDERQAAYERMETIAPWARNVVTSAAGIANRDPERARAFLGQHQQRFIDFGLPPEHVQAGIAGLTDPDPAVRQQWVEQLQAAFTQHTNPEWEINPLTGRAQATSPDGTFIEGAEAPGADLLRRGAVAEIELNERNARAPYSASSVGGGGARPPSGYRWTPDGQALEPITGGPRDPQAQVQRAFPADQRARVAISYDAALEASQFLEQAESQAVRRQGTHGSDTPLGQDWGARMLEAVPFDGGTAARWAGGEDYQQYTRASSAFEAAMLPILSGAAVTESEAQRIVRAALPRQGDSQETLAAKARQRRQMLNGAAMIGGRPPPFPDLGSPPWAASRPAPVGDGIGLDSLTDEQLDALEEELLNAGR